MIPRHGSTPRALVAALALLCLCAFVSGAFGQTESLDGLEIRRIEIDAPPNADVMKIRDTIRTREGDLYRSAAVQRDIAALYALGQYQDITVATERVPQGVALVYRIKTRPQVTEITFKGDLPLPEDELRGLLQTMKDVPANPYVLTTDREALQSHLIDKGYVFAEVLQTVEDAAAGVAIVYVIEPGPRLSIEAVKFSGNTAIRDADLRKEMSSLQPAGLFGRGRYDPSFLHSDLMRIRELFRRKGYLDATVGHEVLYEEGRQRAYVLIRVREGPLYRIEHLILRGMTIFTAAEVLDKIKSADGAPYSQEQLEKDFEAIRDLYGEKGYIKAQIGPERVFSEDRPAVTLTLNVIEGTPYYVRRVLIRGNQRTQDHVVRREVTLLPGGLADSTELSETKRRLANTGLFYDLEQGVFKEPVTTRFVDTDQPDEVDLLVDVTEGGVGDLQVGASISSSVGLTGLLRLTYRNFDARDLPRSWREILRGDAFTGGGQKLTLSLTPGTRYRDYRLSWLNPSVWDSPYSVGFDVYLNDFVLVDYYDDSRVGIAFNIGRELMPDLTVSLTPRYERIEISNIDSGAPADAVKAKGTHKRHSLALGARYDKRDNIFLTTSGYTLEGQLETAGTVLGGDVDLLRETIGARKWWTVWNQEGWGKHVVNIGADMTFTQSTGSGDVPIFERLFMGGLGSLRGFEYRRVGPVEAASKLQLGGNYRLLANAEYEAPLVRDLFRGVVFADTGSLADSLGDIGNEFRASVGVGVRARIPMLGLQQVPLSLYFATPIVKKSYDQTEVFSFTIGTGFEF
jgi:outer membrane protein insertion porin family